MVSLRDVIAAVKAQQLSWTIAGAAIKKQRQLARLLVDGAITPAEVDAVFPISWPT